MSNGNDLIQGFAGTNLGCQIFIIIGICYQHYHHIRVACGGNFCPVKGNQLVTNMDLLAFLHKALEAVALHGYRIHAYMDQNLHAIGRGNANRVLGIGNGGNYSVKGGDYNSLRRFDAYATAQDTGSKRLVRNFLGGNRIAGNRSVNRPRLAGDISGNSLDSFCLRCRRRVIFIRFLQS